MCVPHKMEIKAVKAYKFTLWELFKMEKTPSYY